MKLPKFPTADGKEDKYNYFIRQRIKEAREDYPMTQEELAEKLYKSRVQISDIERGRTAIGAVDLWMIAHLLEKPITYFYPPGTAIEASKLTDSEQELVHYFRGIDSPAMVKYAIKQIKALADASLEASIQQTNREMDEEMLKSDEQPKKPKK